MNGDAQSSLIALLFRNNLYGMGAAALVPFTLLGLVGTKRWRRRPK